MLSDADRLAMISALDGATVTAPGGEFVAYLEEDDASAGAIPVVEGTSPRLVARSSDIERVSLRKGQLVTLNGKQWKVVRHEPDSSGISTVVLQS